MIYTETPSYHGRRRLLLVAVGLLISSSLVSFSHGVSSSCHHRPSSTSFQGKKFGSFFHTLKIRENPFFLWIQIWQKWLSITNNMYICCFFFYKFKKMILGVRRQILEGGNGTLVLAAERTRRPDPLNHFNIYVDGWNVTNTHYIAVSLL